MIFYKIFFYSTNIKEELIHTEVENSYSTFEERLKDVSSSLFRLRSRVMKHLYQKNSDFKEDCLNYLNNMPYIKLIALKQKNQEDIVITYNADYLILLKSFSYNHFLSRNNGQIFSHASKPIDWGNDVIQYYAFPIQNTDESYQWIVAFLSLKSLMQKMNQLNGNIYAELMTLNSTINSAPQNYIGTNLTKRISIFGNTYKLRFYLNPHFSLHYFHYIHFYLFALLILFSLTTGLLYIALYKIDVLATGNESSKKVIEESTKQQDYYKKIIKRQLKALESGTLGVWVWDIQKDILTWNKSMYQIYHVPLDVIPKYETWSSRLLQEDKAQAELEVKEALEGKKSFNTTFRIVSSEKIKQIKAYGTVERNAQGEAEFFIGVNYDVTQSMELFEICKNTRITFWELNLNKKTFSFSTDGIPALNIPYDEIKNYNLKNLYTYLDNKSIKAFKDYIDHIEDRYLSEKYFELSLKNNVITLGVNIIDYVYDEGHKVIRGFFQDISELKRYKDRSITDKLTGLLNRAGVEKALNHLTKHKNRQDDSFAVVYIDIDNLKYVNDQFGHQIGDMLILKISRVMLNHIRQSDHIGRLGGDEFIIIYQQVGKDDILAITDKLSSALNTSLTLNDNQIHVSASIGIALFPDHGIDSLTLIKNADTAMYEVKQEGKNGVKLYDSKKDD